MGTRSGFELHENRTHPTTTNERFHELLASLVDSSSEVVKDLLVNQCHEPLLQVGEMSVRVDEEFEDLDIDKMIDSEDTIGDKLHDVSEAKYTGTSGSTGPSS